MQGGEENGEPKIFTGERGGKAPAAVGRGEKPPEEKFRKLERYFKGLGDGYLMLQRAIEAHEEYQERLEEAKVTPTFKGFLEKAEQRALKTIVLALEEVERPIPERYREKRPVAVLE